jgi:hypothetical protein
MERLSNESQSMGDKGTIIRILNKEIKAHDDAKAAQQRGALNGRIEERIRVKNLVTACEKQRAALQIRFDNIRPRLVKLDLTLGPTELVQDADAQRKMLLKEMGDLMHWLKEVEKGLVDRDLKLLQATEKTRVRVSSDRNDRINGLTKLGDLCGLREDLASQPNTDQRSEDGED